LNGIKASRSAQAYNGSQLLSREPGVRKNQVVEKGNPDGNVLGTQVIVERNPYKAGNGEGADKLDDS
jgi:hypothetical protein